MSERKPNRLQRLVIEAKNRPCADCKGTFPYWVMDLDHRGDEPKFFNPGSAYGSSWTKRDVYRRSEITEAILLAEIAKCDVVCASCHRQRGHVRAAAPIHANGETTVVDAFGVTHTYPDMNEPPPSKRA